MYIKNWWATNLIPLQLLTLQSELIIKKLAYLLLGLDLHFCSSLLLGLVFYS